MWRNTFNMAEFLRDYGTVSNQQHATLDEVVELADLLASLFEIFERLGADVSAAHLSQAVDALREPFESPNLIEN